MSDLLNRLKKAEAVQFLSKKKDTVFFRSFPGIMSKNEVQFIEGTPNIEDFRTLIITWFDSHSKYDDFNYEELRQFADNSNSVSRISDPPTQNNRSPMIEKTVKGSGVKQAFFFRDNSDEPCLGEKKFYETTPNIDDYTVYIYNYRKVS